MLDFNHLKMMYQGDMTRISRFDLVIDCDQVGYDVPIKLAKKTSPAPISSPGYPLLPVFYPMPRRRPNHLALHPEKKWRQDEDGFGQNFAGKPWY